MAEIFSVIHTLAGYAVNPLWGQVEHMLFFNRKIETLRHKLDILKNKETGVQQLVVEATRNAEVIKPFVKDWLQNVDNLKEQACKILENAENSEMQCLFHTCPNLKTRYSLGKEATEKTAEVDELLEEGGTFQRVGETKELVQTPYLKSGDSRAFETRISTKKKIMEALKDQDDVSIIGICGMAGVGKTTMANEIANEVKVDKLFDEVAMAVVSQDPDVIKIQGELADMLGLKIDEWYNKIVRAERLRVRLGGDRRKGTLIILDDVWKEMDLGTIGIPSAGDDKKLKILLTSRSEYVCNNMGAQRKFNINVLSEDESWELFKEKAEISDNETDTIKCMAKEVARECRGLPLALVIVGRALSKRAEHVWKNALNELQNSSVTNIREVHKSVYSSIELSFNHLEGDEAKSLLLLCSLFPEDCSIEIEDLVKYARGLELFRGTETLSATRCRVNTIVDDLESCYLLLLAESKEEDGKGVKLHDVVRDVCLHIAFKEKRAYLLKHIGLNEWPKDDQNELPKDDKNQLYSAISLTSNELNQLPDGLNYPNLEFLRLKGESDFPRVRVPSLNISRDFFADMKELKVLYFSCIEFTRIQILSSIRHLTNLRTLCLNHCTLKIGDSTIENLKELEVLSFFGSTLDHFPSDIKELSNLRYLDLRTYNSCPLSSGILLKLKKLEELYMGIIEIRDDELEQRGYIIEEIRSLSGLNTFQISTSNPQFLLHILHVLCIEKLERFHIRLNDPWMRSEGIRRYFRRRLHISGGITYASMLSEPAIKQLMWRAEHLEIETLYGEVGFEYLNENFPTEPFDELQAFERLQKIFLGGMPRMKHLWRGVIKPRSSFHNLMALKIGYSPSVKSLFPESAASCMEKLQSIFIYDCERLEEIFYLDTEQNEVTEMLEFPKLQEIKLHKLRNFKSFRSGSNELVDVHNPLFKQVTLPNLERLTIFELSSVKILDELRQIRSHNLRYMDIEKLDDMSILFDFEDTKDDAEIRILSQLTSLKVKSLPKLVHITRMFPTGIHIFENLTKLKVTHCDNLNYLFSPSMASSLVALKYLEVFHCGALEEIIGRQEEDNTSNIVIVEEGTTRRIMFPKLRNLSLSNLGRLRFLSSQNYELVFPSLNYLEIANCPVMTKFCSRQSAPMLDKVRLNFGRIVDISNFMDSEGSIHI